MFDSKGSRIEALPGCRGSRIRALLSHERSGLRGCLGSKSHRGLSNHKRIRDLHNDDINVSSMSLYLFQELSKTRAIFPFLSLPLLLDFFDRWVLGKRNLGQIPEWGGQGEVNGIKSSNPPLKVPCHLGFLYDPGSRVLSIVETEVVVDLLSMLQILLNGHELFISGHDDT